MQLDTLYQEIILDHYKHPHGRGLRDAADPADQVGEAHHVNPTCGDEVTIRVATDGDVLHDVSYDGMGCSISQASASVLHELLTGRNMAEAFEVHTAFVTLVSGRGQVAPDEDVLGDGVAFEGVARYPARVKCALLPWMAFKDAAARAGVGASPTEVKA
ncbi:Fe-S cluster assembly sulfur transfer protein SufU [Micromonospora endophytica]|uniref:SUF system NifU family Fe-S cluster assembly protein n=1 Tax=Micromonospora endophytica TaxID=515350 RepID=A0A2W2D2P6_9ACTN|nr:SUF system NifU family Fe-S cluster assembly protein [Micromonospora endophytica]PZF97918.1 SUF system NifU family Fe-S cluster assembly protein [Micromonospora endophytica]RIW43003.1 SUF system NifU family Fe-S cluster assembly protein [Micromonospora endophytica]BCJ61337.1 iron-sulfur cluster assembly scaffold protein NifU [Micromonospora endophytica]